MGSCQSIEEDVYFRLGDGSLKVKLSETDMKLINASWLMIKDHAEIGMLVMIR